MTYHNTDHTFSVCAYKESEYLEELLISLTKQTVKTNILIATSTPNEHIYGLAQKYNLPVYVNTGEKGIAGDWNFAVKSASTSLVTIAHQDDTYEPTYAEEMIKAMNRVKNPLIAFSQYAELRGQEKVTRSKLLNIKKILLLPFKFSSRSIFLRRRSLSLGNAICCPSVTYLREIALANPFNTAFSCDLDWAQWECLSKLQGDFVYIAKPLMGHRIHEASATSQLIEDSRRSQEDYQMFCKFWPRWVAAFIERFYAASENSNNL